jgi:hypothetical protein
MLLAYAVCMDVTNELVSSRELAEDVDLQRQRADETQRTLTFTLALLAWSSRSKCVSKIQFAL